MLLQFFGPHAGFRVQNHASYDGFATLTTCCRGTKNQAVANRRMEGQYSLDAFGRNLSPGNVNLITDTPPDKNVPSLDLAEIAGAKNAICQLHRRCRPITRRHCTAAHLKAAIFPG